MNTKPHFFPKSLVLFLAAILTASPVFAQQTTAFTYQGQLRDGGTNANGTYAMTFKLYGLASGSTQIGSTVASNPTLANGLFSVNLDFGADAFNGRARWLEITVEGETLLPRVQVLPTPYALFAAVAATVTNHAIMNEQLANDAVADTNIMNLAVTAAKIDNSAVTTAKIADGNVTNPKLGVPAVAGFNIFDGAITAAKIADGNVTNPKLAANAVATANIQDAAVTNPKLAADAAANGNIQNNAVTAAKIAAGNVVKSLNGLTDAVTISAGDNITLTETGNDIQISAALTNSTVIGPWNIDSGPVTVPTGGGTVSDALRFRTFGATRFGIDRDGNGAVVFGDFLAEYIRAISTIECINLDATDIDCTGDLNATTVAANDVYGRLHDTSDRSLKENFEAISSREILERVAILPISSWNFRQGEKARHIGPMAQDFYAAFNVGADDKHIATVDANGVALAAIQGLNEKLKDKDATIESLAKRLADLEALLKSQSTERSGKGQ